MALIDARGIPADQTSVDRLAAQDLDYRVLDTTDSARVAAFQRAMARGFLGADPSEAAREEGVGTLRSRRNIGVYEPDTPADRFPVATIDSWVTPLTIPGGEIGMWAISGVTVAGTHRRRGIARALLEGSCAPPPTPVSRSPGSRCPRRRSTDGTASALPSRCRGSPSTSAAPDGRGPVPRAASSTSSAKSSRPRWRRRTSGRVSPDRGRSPDGRPAGRASAGSRAQTPTGTGCAVSAIATSPGRCAA